MKIEILDPEHHGLWDDLLMATEKGSFFHLSCWQKVLSLSYRYRPVCFVARLDGQPAAMLPVIEVDSFLTGRRGVALPFTDYCEPVADSGETFLALFERIIDYGRKTGWKRIELRGGQQYLAGKPISAAFLGHALQLSDNTGQLMVGFSKNTSRSIKKALANGVEVKKYSSAESVKEFYRLHCLTRKRHGIPPQPFRFFRNIYDCVISRQLGFVLLASHGNRFVAGAVCFHCGNTAIYKYGASDQHYIQLNANHLVMFEAIKWYAQNGYEKFCFGRTDPDNAGLRQFKKSWGAEEKPINYYTYDISKEAFVSGSTELKEAYGRYFRDMPIPFHRLAGALLYRHIG